MADETRKAAPEFYRNLILLMVLGVAFSAWLLHYTDWFETVGGLLALGGAFSWLAFISKLLPEDVLKQLQWRSVDFLEARQTGIAIRRMLYLFLFLGSLFGSILVETRQDGFGHYLFVYSKSREMGDPMALPPAQAVHIVRPAFPWGSTYWLKIPGLPSNPITFRPWWLNTVYVPHYFDRRVFLVRASGDLAFTIIGKKIPLRVTINRKVGGSESTVIGEYNGYSFWLNCSQAEMPAVRQIAMAYDIPNGADPETFKNLWIPPRPLMGTAAVKWDDLALTEGDEIVLKDDSNDPYIAEYHELVHASKSYDDSVVVIRLLRYIKGS